MGVKGKRFSDMTIHQLKRVDIVLAGRIAQYENISMVRKLTRDEIELVDNMKGQKTNVAKQLAK